MTIEETITRELSCAIRSGSEETEEEPEPSRIPADSAEVECDWCDDGQLYPRKEMHIWGEARALICEDCWQKMSRLYGWIK